MMLLELGLAMISPPLSVATAISALLLPPAARCCRARHLTAPMVDGRDMKAGVPGASMLICSTARHSTAQTARYQITLSLTSATLNRKREHCICTPTIHSNSHRLLRSHPTKATFSTLC